MKIFKLLTLLLVVASGGTNEVIKDDIVIHLNQLGYYPKSVKKAIVVDSAASEFEIQKTDGTKVFAGKLSESKYWDKSDETVKVADFSELVEKGTYVLSVNGTKSYEFEIKDNLYAEALDASLKSYYFSRASVDLDEKHAGKWHRKAGHLDTNVQFHPSAQRGEDSISSTGGWYDAGDPGKYIINGGVTVGTLLNTYEFNKEVIGDDLNIPESGNNKSDLLDEIKVEMDWALTMQAPDGAAHHKLTAKGFPGFVMPVDDDTERFIIGKPTGATLNLAAMAAQSARLFQDYDKEFANKCLEAAKKAWAWAVKNPTEYFKNPADVQTGEYGDDDMTEEFWWAAAELYLTTKEQTYLDYLKNNEPYVEIRYAASWSQFLGNLGSYSILLSDDEALNEIREIIKTKIIASADEQVTKTDTIPYRITMDVFEWGSSSYIQNTAMMLIYAYKLTGEQKYLDATIENMDYIFGKNATGYSFLTGYGDKVPMFLHNRFMAPDNIEDPHPGFIAGGPNAAREDDISKSEWGIKYNDTLPAKCYMDVQGSYASNETCINWNAPTVFVLGFLEANTDKLQ